MKNSLYNSDTLQCSVIAEKYQIEDKSLTVKEIVFKDCHSVSNIDFDIDGEAYIVWPNREGEGFPLNSVYPKLKNLGYSREGLSLSYPATASLTAFLVKKNANQGFLFYMAGDDKGRIREIRISSRNPQQVKIRIAAVQNKWIIIKYENENDLSAHFNFANSNRNIIKRQFQLGLINPDGETEIPLDKGFHIIPDVARLLIPKYGNDNNIIHIFGYAKGHDLMYPDYTPSEILGSVTSLKEAISETRNLGFETSFYLNGRIIDSESLIQFPHLENSVLKDQDGNKIEEYYQNRTFYVMDPSSIVWQDCLIRSAGMLYDCGAYAVQLDQLGGRAAVKEIGEIWGQGYNRIIGKIHEIGLKVWIQGISDLYEADWFEMTFRNVDILNGGIIRGGNPLGKTDLSLLNLFLRDKTFLLTESKKLHIEQADRYDLITDYPDYKGELPLYSDNYIKSLINAEAALR